MKPSYRSKMSFIRPFVTFDFKRPERVKPSTKAKITKYYNFLESNRQNFAFIKPSKGQSLSAVQKDLNPSFGRIPKKIAHTEFSGIFVPVNQKRKKITYDRRKKRYALGKRRGAFGEIQQEFIIPLNEDPDAFALDAGGYTEKLIEEYPSNTIFKIVNPQDWEGPGFDKAAIINEIKFFFDRYQDAFQSAIFGDEGWSLLVQLRG